MKIKYNLYFLVNQIFKVRICSLSMSTILICILAITSSCQKDTGVENENGSTDEYYVKYEVSSKTIYSGGKLDVIVKTEENKNLRLVIDQNVLHETVIGPVNKGFIANLEVVAQGNTHDKLKLYTGIYVSKNGGPFATKKIDGSDSPRDIVELEYKINF